jgi:Holliday junction DNA helicase RuvB
MDERVVSARAQEEEAATERGLRPRALSVFVGQAQLRQKLGISLQAARQREEPLGHALFSGPPGLGKTTLAGIIAAEMGGKLTTTSGPALEKVADLMGIQTNLQAGDILFIDEIHRLPRTLEEYLYTAMEDFAVDFVLDKGPFAKAIRLALKPFTLVGATTREGLLSNPLRDRFDLRYALDFYAPDELSEIVERSAGLLKMPVESQAAWELACRSRGTPRIANRLLRRVRDYAQVRGESEIGLSTARAALELEGVDTLGLDDLDRKVLEAIITRYNGGPVGIEALAATLQQEVDTLTDVVEPFLLQTGFLIRTSNGRRATARSYEHLGYEQPRTGGNGAQSRLPLE